MLSQSELTIYNQRQVEQIFAAQVFTFPVYSVVRAGWLSPDMLLDNSVRSFWQTVKDSLTVTSDDNQAGAVVTQAAAKAGILQDLVAWQRLFPYESDPGAFAQEIGRRHYLTRMSQQNNLLAQAIGRGDDNAVRELINSMHSEVPIAQTNLQTVREVNERFKQIVRQGVRSLPTFLPKLDLATGGLERQTLTILGGRTGMGKTAFSGQIARNCAESGKTVIYFSLEMSATAMYQRWACPLVGVEWRQVTSGNISAAKQDELIRAGDEIADRLGDKLIIQDTPQSSESVWRIVATARPDLIIVDHIRFMKDKAESENKRLGKITENLHDLAKAQDIPVMAIAQLNRETDKRDNKVPQLGDLRDSGEIEENADNVWFIYRPDYYNEDIPKTKASSTEIHIAKFRNGPADIKVNLTFNLREEWFE